MPEIAIPIVLKTILGSTRGNYKVIGRVKELEDIAEALDRGLIKISY